MRNEKGLIAINCVLFLYLSGQAITASMRLQLNARGYRTIIIIVDVINLRDTFTG